MRVVVFSITVFLCVTVLILHRASAEPARRATEASSLIADSTLSTPTAVTHSSVEPATSVAQRSLASVAVLSPAVPVVRPRATPPQSPTIRPAAEIDPMVELVDESLGENLSVADTVATGAEETEIDAAATDMREPLGASDNLSEIDAPELTSLIDDPAWAGAIHTRDGGIIGLVISNTANVRAAPTTSSEVVVELYDRWPVTLYAQVRGEWVGATDVWYQTWSGSYVSAAVVAPFVAPEPETLHAGHWLDINLSLNYVIAYVDDTPVNAMIVMTGMEGFETPVGDYTIFRRVETDTLDAGTLGYDEDDPEYYYLTGVNYVQYFAEGGFALHSNYWSDPWEFGLSRSHGCINLIEEDAAWLWLFLDADSVVSVHY